MTSNNSIAKYAIGLSPLLIATFTGFAFMVLNLGQKQLFGIPIPLTHPGLVRFFIGWFLSMIIFTAVLYSIEKYALQDNRDFYFPDLLLHINNLLGGGYGALLVYVFEVARNQNLPFSPYHEFKLLTLTGLIGTILMVALLALHML